LFVVEKSDTQYSVNKHGLKSSTLLPQKRIKQCFLLAKRS